VFRNIKCVVVFAATMLLISCGNNESDMSINTNSNKEIETVAMEEQDENLVNDEDIQLVDSEEINLDDLDIIENKELDIEEINENKDIVDADDGIIENSESNELIEAAEIENSDGNLEQTELIEEESIIHNVKTGVPLKKIKFVEEGKFIGGNSQLNKIINEVKWGNWKEYERLVFEVGSVDNEKSSNDELYYEVVMVEDKPLIVAVFGGDYDLKKNLPNVKNSKLIDKLEVLDLRKKGYCGFSINLKENKKIRLFELKNPKRIVIDIEK